MEDKKYRNYPEEFKLEALEMLRHSGKSAGQIESCRYGFDGWLLWTWDTEDTLGFWNALSQGSEIEKVLAPVNRPDPCH